MWHWDSSPAYERVCSLQPALQVDNAGVSQLGAPACGIVHKCSNLPGCLWACRPDGSIWEDTKSELSGILYTQVVVLRLPALLAGVEKVYDGIKFPLYFRSLTLTKTFPWHAETKELVSQDGLASVAEIM